MRGEAVVDDTVLFDGEVTGVRIEPTPTMPGLRAAVIGPGADAAGWPAAPRSSAHPARWWCATACRGAAAGAPVDVLPAHRGLAAGR